MKKKKYIEPSSYARKVVVKLLDASPKNANTETVNKGQSVSQFSLDDDF